MKFYIAARSHQKEEVRKLQSLLIANGHSITSDWTLHKNIKPYEQNQELARDYAIEDIEGLKNSDAVIFLTSEEIGLGITTELGAAILAHTAVGKPTVHIVGTHWDRNLFYFHPSVQRYSSLDELLQKFNIKSWV